MEIDEIVVGLRGIPSIVSEFRPKPGDKTEIKILSQHGSLQVHAIVIGDIGREVITH